MSVREILQVGEKGGDLILKTFSKINKEKEKFKTPAETKLSAKIPGAAPAPISEEKENKFINKFGEQFKKFSRDYFMGPQKPKDEEEKREGIKLRENTAKAADGLKELASSATSLDPTRFTSGLIDAVGDVSNKLLGAIPVVGQFAAAFGEGATEMAKMSSTMASNSLTMIKSAQNTAIDTMEKKARLSYYGGGALKNQGYMLSEKSGIVEAISSKYGRIGKDFADTINQLFSTNPDIQQATALASGNYKALGTDKGFFMQQIADSFGNLPPSMAQNLQNQLLKQFTTPEGEEEVNKDLAVKQRNMRAVFDNQHRSTEEQISNMTENAAKLDNELNKLSINLARGGTGLIGAIEALTKQINFVMTKIQSGGQGKKPLW